ncbi:MAG TPA: ROK family protein [Propionibacteriaceae bacterium]|nr:ROK family protein [Propionibacteriaceae bacterium]
MSTEPTSQAKVVLGIDVGGTATNSTVLDEHGHFLVDGMVEVPSRVTDGPAAALEAVADVIALVLEKTGVSRDRVLAVGLDTPGPANATGVISSLGATNFSDKEWWGYDFRGGVESHIGLPVVYNNDGNAAALYAHRHLFGEHQYQRSSVSAIVGTGLGGGVIEMGEVVKGAAGMAGELGHIRIPMGDLLVEGQPVPQCNCGLYGDVESIASLTGIRKSLLPFWLTQYPDHPLHDMPIDQAAKAVRGYGVDGDEMALKIFDQQAHALGELFMIASNFTDPHAYLVGGGVIEAAPHFRDWFLDRVRAHTPLRAESAAVAQFALVTDLDMAGARGAALAALHAI